MKKSKFPSKYTTNLVCLCIVKSEENTMKMTTERMCTGCIESWVQIQVLPLIY